MGRGHYVFDYDAEPADERPTGFGQTNFGQSGLAALSTIAAPWTASEHSTFDQPSHAIEGLRPSGSGAGAHTWWPRSVLLAVSIVASAVTLAMR